MNKVKFGKISLFSLCLVLFLDGLGQGVMFPILSKLLDPSNKHIILSNYSESMKQVYYGLTIGLFFLFWFYGSAFLSDLSDRLGRKLTLLICLSGLFLGNLLSGLSLSLNSIFLLLFSRIIMGLFSADQAIAQAIVIESTSKEKQEKVLGYIFFALCLGIVSGPSIGYFLSDTDLFFWFSDSTPFYFVTLLILVNIYLVYRFVDETYTPQSKAKISLNRSIEIFKQAIQHKQVRFLTLCFVMSQTGWSIYLLYTPDFLVSSLGLKPISSVGFMSLCGLGLSIGYLFLVPKVAGKWQPKLIYSVGIIVVGLVSLLTGLFRDSWFIWYSELFVGIAFALSYPSLCILFSKQVGKDQQGWVMGIMSATMALSSGIAILAGSVLSIWSTTGVYLLSFVLTMTSAFLIYRKTVLE